MLDLPAVLKEILIENEWVGLSERHFHDPLVRGAFKKFEKEDDGFLEERNGTFKNTEFSFNKYGSREEKRAFWEEQLNELFKKKKQDSLIKHGQAHPL